MYGTILHQDSALASVLKNREWGGIRLEACDENLGNVLWPEKFTRERLEAIKRTYIADGDLSGFNMEYRNIAVDAETSFFRPSDFLPMSEEDHKRAKTFYVGGDLAFSKKEKRDWTVFVVGGIDDEGILHVVDERRGRWDGKEVIDEMYRIEEAWAPQEWFIESGAIKESLGTALELRFAAEGFLNLRPGLVPTKDKAVRANPLQARMRMKGIRFDTEASWFPDYKQEMLEFAQEGTRGAHDDRVDASAWLAQGIKTMAMPLNADEREEEDLRAAWASVRAVAANDEDASSYDRMRAMTWGRG
jgi:predicted phage terminase large subunit-like protein